MKSQFEDLDLYTIRGSHFEAGRRYGEIFRKAMHGFFQAEIEPYLPKKEKLVSDTLRAIKNHAPRCYRFMQGMSDTSDLTLRQHTLLLMHEELYHLRRSREQKKKGHTGHCSAVAVGGERGSLIGQNWDWGTALLPWGSLVRYVFSKKKRVIAYNYPGLPACCGVNSDGLALVWTGAGYYPPIPPLAGVPSYALIYEIFQKSNTAAAVSYLRRTPIAGPFIFVVGDASGDTRIVEATAKILSVSQVRDFDYRANYFCDAATCKSSKQKLPGVSECHSKKRMKALKSFARLHSQPNISQLRQALSLDNVFVELKHGHLSLDQFAVDCRAKKLSTRRGLRDQGGEGFRSWRQKWREYRA